MRVIDFDPQTFDNLFDNIMRRKGDLFAMKTIKLTDEQFDTLFEYVDGKVESIVNTSVDYQDSQLLEDFEDLFEVHEVLDFTKNEYEEKTYKGTGKTTKGRVVIMKFMT